MLHGPVVALDRFIQVEPVDKGINHPNLIILADPVLKPLRKQGGQVAISAIDKTIVPIA